MNKNFYWKNRLNKGINKNNLNSVTSTKPNNQPAPILIELDNLDNNKNKSSYINYSVSKNDELGSNFHTDIKSYNMIKELLTEVKLIKSRLSAIESNIGDIKDNLSTLSAGDILFDGDLKLNSDVRIPDNGCGDDICNLTELDINESEIGLDHRETFVPVLADAHRHPSNLTILRDDTINMTLNFNCKDLDSYIIYPFGNNPSPIPTNGLKRRLYIDIDSKHHHIFDVHVNNLVISWVLVGLIDDGNELTVDVDMSNVNQLLFKEPVSFLYD